MARPVDQHLLERGAEVADARDRADVAHLQPQHRRLPDQVPGWAGATVSRSCASVHGFGAGCAGGCRVLGAGVVADPPAADPSAARPGSSVAGEAVSPLGSGEVGPSDGGLGVGEPTAAAGDGPLPPPLGRIAQISSSTTTIPANATARRRQ